MRFILPTNYGEIEHQHYNEAVILKIYDNDYKSTITIVEHFNDKSILLFGEVNLAVQGIPKFTLEFRIANKENFNQSLSNFAGFLNSLKNLETSNMVDLLCFLYTAYQQKSNLLIAKLPGGDKFYDISYSISELRILRLTDNEASITTYQPDVTQEVFKYCINHDIPITPKTANVVDWTKITTSLDWLDQLAESNKLEAA